jgi:hypothetical protein
MLLTWLMLAVVMGLPPRGALAQPHSPEAPRAGQVLLVKGIATAQREGTPARFLGKGAKLYQGDTVTTSSKGFVILKLIDESVITLRPGTVFKLETVNYRPEKKESSNAFLRLLKGGMRAITGFISKLNPKRGVRIQTPVATIGIRGTDFDARLCTGDCAEEAKHLKKRKIKTRKVAARVAFLRNEVTAQGHDGKLRKLQPGAPIYAGDRIQTKGDAYAVLAFRDRSRITLREATRMLLAEYRYSRKAEKSRMEVLLAEGGLRVLAGKIGEQNPAAVKFHTPLGTVGIDKARTGFDLLCRGACAEEGRKAGASLPLWLRPLFAMIPPAHAQAAPTGGLFAYSWQGTIRMQLPSGTLEISENKTLFVPPGGRPVELPKIPVFIQQDASPRPDGVKVDHRAMFGRVKTNESKTGLFVTVRDGHVTLQTGLRSVDLGGGESGFADPNTKQTIRLSRTPTFIAQDPIPHPSQYDPETGKIVDQIKEDLGPSGKKDMECEIR